MEKLNDERNMLIGRAAKGALVRYLLNIHLTMCDKLENRCDLAFKILVKKLKYIKVFFTLGVVHQHSKRRGGRRERKREEGGGLWPVPRIKLNKFYVRTA